MIWTINGHEPKDLGVSRLHLQQANLAAGSLTFTATARDIDAPYLFDDGETVNLHGADGVKWSGPCIRRPVSGRAGAEDQKYTVAGPWWYLEHIPYLQEWTINGGTGTAWLSRCILGVAGNGTRLSIGDTVKAVVNYARNCGAPVQVGDIVLAGLFPVEEVKGLMCSEVIRRVLRWMPDAVAWWTFGDGSASLNIQRRAALAAKSVAVGVVPHETVNIAPREDMKPSAVVLVYERTDTIDGKPVTTTGVDAAPEGADGRQVGALVYTIPLTGGTRTFLKQTIKVRTIPTNLASGPGLRAARQYWGRLLGLMETAAAVAGQPDTPEITFFPVYGVSGPYFDQVLAKPDGYDGTGPYDLEDPADAGSAKIRVDKTLPSELITGTVTPWMTGVKAQRQLWGMKISYTQALTTRQTYPEVVWVPITATDASSRLYTQIESDIGGEEVAVGLAAQLLAAFSTPHYQGEVSILEEECSGDRGLGNVLNLTGGRPEWGTMKAVIQQMTEDLDAGRTTYTVGPPEHLGPQDLIELQRCDRRPEGNTGQQGANVTQRGTGLL